MAWYNIYRNTKQALRDWGWMERIHWQDVIQLDPALDKNPPYKVRIVAELVKWEKTDEGQSMLAELKDAQSRIPKGHQWKMRDDDKRIPEYDRHAAVSDMAKIVARHSDPRKLFLYVSPQRKEDFSTYDKYADGAYSLKEHMLTINLLVQQWQLHLVPKIINGISQSGPQTFVEIAQHETRHAVDNLNRKFGKTVNVTKPLYEECMEARGVVSERALQAELGLPQRYAYHDVTLELQQILAKGAKATPEGYAQLRQTLIEHASYDAVGCTLENSLNSPAIALRKAEETADKAMKAHGIKIIR